jgi:hypothetical protein
MVAAAIAGITSVRPAAAVEPPQVTIKPTDDGLVIDAGSMGQFVLSYPAIYKKGEHNYEDAKTYQLVEKQPAGDTALLKYAGGAQARVEVQANQTVLVSFSAMPGDVQQFRMDMHSDISYGQGGRFKIGQLEVIRRWLAAVRNAARGEDDCSIGEENHCRSAFDETLGLCVAWADLRGGGRDVESTVPRSSGQGS